MTAQLPAFIFYVGAMAVLMIIIAGIEAFGDRYSAKRREENRREALRARAWDEIERLD